MFPAAALRKPVAGRFSFDVRGRCTDACERMLVRRVTAALEVAVCALATHALVYRTLWPNDGVHRYFGWYEPVVTVVSLASLVGLLGFVAVAWAARLRGRPLYVAARVHPAPIGATARSVGAWSLAFLLIQESVERSLETGQPALQVFTPSEWLVLFAGLAATSLLLAVGVRIARTVLDRALGSTAVRRRRRRVALGWSVVTCSRRRLRPLAERFALRAPPLAP